MSLLDGDIRVLFGEVFGEFYLDGSLVSVTNTDDGYGGYTQTTSTQACKLQVDACTDRQKLEQGYTARDVRVLVLQASITGRPSPGNRIVAKGIEYVCGPVVTEDPASSYYEVRGIPL